MAEQEKRFNFTKDRIERLDLPEPGKRDVYWDEKVPCLALRITDKGARSFYVVRRVKGGSPEWNRLGAFHELTIKQAQQQAMEAGARLAAGESLAAQRRAASKDPTFEDLFTWWHERHIAGRKSEAYSKDTRRQFDSYLVDFGKVKASRITRGDVRRLHETIGVDHGPYQANRVLATVRAVYNKAIAHEQINCANPASGVEAHPETTRERRLLPGEIAGFLEAVAAEPNGDIRDYVLVSLFTGARKANVLAMKWEHIDLVGGTWHLPTTKNGRPQVIPLGPEEIKILKRRHPEGGGVVNTPRNRATVQPSQGGGWVFPGTGESGHLAEPKKGWRRILERACLATPKPKPKRRKRADAGAAEATATTAKNKPAKNTNDLRLHDLRRTLGSFMADSGAGLNVIGKALNHLSPQATQIYARLALDPVRQAKEQAMALMLGN